jgi:hypothetical protein
VGRCFSEAPISRSKNEVSSILLMTDGLANVGITSRYSSISFSLAIFNSCALYLFTLLSMGIINAMLGGRVHDAPPRMPQAPQPGMQAPQLAQEEALQFQQMMEQVTQQAPQVQQIVQQVAQQVPQVQQMVQQVAQQAPQVQQMVQQVAQQAPQVQQMVQQVAQQAPQFQQMVQQTNLSPPFVRLCSG